MSRDDLLSTPSGIEDALYGVYAQMRSETLYGKNLSVYYLEVMAQTMNCSNNSEIAALGQYDYKYSYVEDMFESIWTMMYSNISNVNSVLNSKLVADAKEYPYTLYRGEALGLRAFMHFDLVRLFCEQYTQNPEAKGIPYQTQFSLVTPDFESLAKNYDHILADLLEAELLLADEKEYAGTSTFTTDRQTHFNLYAVQALLARVYLTMGNKQMAYEYAKKVIDHSGLKLAEKEAIVGSTHGDVAGVLSKTEAIFGVYYADFFSIVNPLLEKNQDQISLDPRSNVEAIYDREADGHDFRFDANFRAEALGSATVLRLQKFTDPFELNNHVADRPSNLILGINLLRLPEMYYICAETLLEENYDDALDYFDAVLEHRGLQPLSKRTTDNKLTQDRINLDFYKEFFGEGKIFFNQKRQNLDIESFTGETTYKASKNIYVVPIPDVEYENRY